jgi:ribosome maturation factor RimP
MKIERVTLMKGLTISQDYDSWRCNVELSATVDDGEDHIDVVAELSKQIEAILDEESRGQSK